MHLPAPSAALKHVAPQAATGRSAPLEALAQAQSMWNSGAHMAANGMGALRPDVANYLRQLGVVIRND